MCSCFRCVGVGCPVRGESVEEGGMPLSGGEGASGLSWVVCSLYQQAELRRQRAQRVGRRSEWMGAMVWSDIMQMGQRGSGGESETARRAAGPTMRSGSRETTRRHGRRPVRKWPTAIWPARSYAGTANR